jgi:hypothetical protein
MSRSEPRERAARTKEVLTSIERGLREQYDPAQPFSERLARLSGKSARPGIGIPRMRPMSVYYVGGNLIRRIRVTKPCGGGGFAVRAS